MLAASDVLPAAMGIMHELDSKQRCRGVTVPLSGTYMAPACVCASDLSLLNYCQGSTLSRWGSHQMGSVSDGTIVSLWLYPWTYIFYRLEASSWYGSTLQ